MHVAASTVSPPSLADVQALALRCAEAGDTEISNEFKQRFGVYPEEFIDLGEKGKDLLDDLCRKSVFNALDELHANDQRIIRAQIARNMNLPAVFVNKVVNQWEAERGIKVKSAKDFIEEEMERTLHSNPKIGLSLSLRSVAKRLEERGIKVSSTGTTQYYVNNWRDANLERVIAYENRVNQEKLEIKKREVWGAADTLESKGEVFFAKDVAKLCGRALEVIAPFLNDWSNNKKSEYLRFDGYEVFKKTIRAEEKIKLVLELDDDLFFALQNMAGDRETSVEGVVQSILRRSVNLDSEAVLSKDGGALRCDDSPALGM